LKYTRAEQAAPKGAALLFGIGLAVVEVTAQASAAQLRGVRATRSSARRETSCEYFAKAGLLEHGMHAPELGGRAQDGCGQ